MLLKPTDHRWNIVKNALPLVLCIGIFAPLFGGYPTEISFKLLFYAALSEAWNLVAGYGGLISFGSSAFIGTGAYLLFAIINQTDVSTSAFGIIVTLIAGGLGAAIVATLIMPAVLRLRGLYFAVGTLALSEASRLIVTNIPFFGGATGLFLKVDPPPLPILNLYAALLFVVSSGAVTFILSTRASILLRAVRDDEDAASQVGIRAFRVKAWTFVLSGFLMGMAGALQGLKLGAIEPYGMFGFQWSIDVLAIVIIGGLGNRWGAILGAAFYIILGELLADFPEIHTAITGVILIILVRFAPSGLASLVFGRLNSLVSRTTERQQNEPPGIECNLIVDPCKSHPRQAPCSPSKN